MNKTMIDTDESQINIIEIRELLLTLKKRFLIILLTTVLFAGIAGAVTNGGIN